MNIYTRVQYIKRFNIIIHVVTNSLHPVNPISQAYLTFVVQKRTNMINAEKNKAIIAKFDTECIEQNNIAVMDEMVSDKVINHAAQPGKPNGKDSFHHFLSALHAGLSDIKVTILRQVAENDLVVTHKLISGTHSGNLFGNPETGQPVSFEAIEIIRLEDGKYAEHWVQSNMAMALGTLKGH